jgi:hypothetical protein
MDANPLISLPTGGFTYCMYPHTWAFENEVDDLLITWSEGSLAGNVVAARVRLQTEKIDKSRIE